MKLVLAIATLLAGLLITAVAAFFSVSGLMALFAGAALSVGIMGAVLEFGKIVAAAFLHTYMKSHKLTLFWKTYLIIGVVFLMLVTNLGIFGYLSKGHLEQSASLPAVELKIAQKEQRIQQLNTQLSGLNTRLNQMDGAVNSLIASNKANTGLRARGRQSAERVEISKSIETTTAEINKVSDELVPLKLEVSGVEAKLGPVKYLGFKDTETAVRVVIFFIMIAFEPMAVALIICSLVAFHDYFEAKPKKNIEIVESDPVFLKDKEEEAVDVEPLQELIADPEEEPEVAEGSLLVDEVEEQTPQPNDTDVLLGIFKRNPELFQEVIDAITEAKTTPTEVEQPAEKSWLENWTPPRR
jgi:hypothetical protein